jgi:DNA topoisomerase-1
MEQNIVKLDFLAKDSVRYNRTLPVSEQVYKNLEEFMKGKKKSEDVFDKITSTDVNKYLQLFMKDLSAKVFRTYNASSLFQKELNKINKKYDKTTTLNILLDEFNRANAKVALLCNHQKNINKNTNEQIEKIDAMIKKIRGQVRKAKTTAKKQALRDRIKKLKIKKDLRIELKNVSLGTSKTNYIDPRITVAFLKKFDIPVDKVFSVSLREKFKWAFDVDVDYEF